MSDPTSPPPRPTPPALPLDAAWPPRPPRFIVGGTAMLAALALSPPAAGRAPARHALPDAVTGASDSRLHRWAATPGAAWSR